MMSLKDLGFLEYNLRALLDALALPYGAILVTGPTGSVSQQRCTRRSTKRTTEVQPHHGRRPCRVSSRRALAGSGARASGPDLASALRSILRQDPDKIMIGEIRDKETGTIAIEAALTATSSSPPCTRTTLPRRSPGSPRWASSRSSRRQRSRWCSRSGSHVDCAPRVGEVRPGGRVLSSLGFRTNRGILLRCTAREAARSAGASATRDGWAFMRSCV